MNPELKELPLPERVQLVEDLWDSIAEEQHSLGLTTAQKAELDKRLSALEQSVDQGRDAFEFMDELRKKL
ncbi:addiction module protein [Marinospirillum perlucidum]|uniref:addiction module protein n=1 Tax=Marinospirillum perlucidum TaxID=1982602 RepID=UPI000DF4B032|nr:addiction module protein [Marinospirillum perlucidum]